MTLSTDTVHFTLLTGLTLEHAELVHLSSTPEDSALAT